MTERINEPPWGRCLQGAVDARWVVVDGVVVVVDVVVVVVVFCLLVVVCCLLFVVCCLLLLASSPHRGSGITSSRALGITVTLLRSNGDASMGLDDGPMR